MRIEGIFKEKPSSLKIEYLLLSLVQEIHHGIESKLLLLKKTSGTLCLSYCLTHQAFETNFIFLLLIPKKMFKF